MDKSLLEIEERLKNLGQPARSETSRLRLEHLVDELAADVTFSHSASTASFVDYELTEPVQKTTFPRVLSRVLYAVAACVLLGLVSFFYSSGLSEKASFASANSELLHVISAADGLISDPLEYVSSDTVVQMLAVEESLSEDGETLYRVERYSVLDSDIYKDPSSGHMVTLQQSRKEERRNPVTYF